MKLFCLVFCYLNYNNSLTFVLYSRNRVVADTRFERVTPEHDSGEMPFLQSALRKYLILFSKNTNGDTYKNISTAIAEKIRKDLLQ